MQEPASSAQPVQQQYFRMTDSIPEEAWYWAAMASVLGSALLFLLHKREWSNFVGQWPPTFLLLGVFHRLLRPSQ